MGDFWPRLFEQRSTFLAFFASFALVSVFWAAHMVITRRLQVFDWPTVWANMLFLLSIALTPFAFSLIGATARPGAHGLSIAA